MKGKRTTVRLAALAAVGALATAALGAQGKEADRLHESATVLKEILDIPDNIPKDLMDKAECVIVFPSVKKVALGVGGSYGRGAITCRSGENHEGAWSAPAMFALEGGSIGAQIGGEAIDYVLLVMNDRGANSVLGSKVKIGADASAAAGPKGRAAGASTDIVMNAEMLTYSRSKGLFAGVSLEGSTLREDGDANKALYGKAMTAREIVKGKVEVPAAAKPLVDLLNQRSPKNLSEHKTNSR